MDEITKLGSEGPVAMDRYIDEIHKTLYRLSKLVGELVKSENPTVGEVHALKRTCQSIVALIHIQDEEENEMSER